MIEISKYWYNIKILYKWVFGCKVPNRNVSNDYPIGEHIAIGVRPQVYSGG